MIIKKNKKIILFSSQTVSRNRNVSDHFGGLYSEKGSLGGGSRYEMRERLTNRKKYRTEKLASEFGKTLSDV